MLSVSKCESSICICMRAWWQLRTHFVYIVRRRKLRKRIKLTLNNVSLKLEIQFRRYWKWNPWELIFHWSNQSKYKFQRERKEDVRNLQNWSWILKSNCFFLSLHCILVMKVELFEETIGRAIIVVSTKFLNHCKSSNSDFIVRVDVCISNSVSSQFYHST